MGQQRDGEVDQVGLPGLEVIGDAGPVGVLEDAETRDKQQGGSKVDGQGNGDVSGDIGPAADPRGHATAPQRRQDKGLVVDTTGGGVDGGDLGQGKGDAHDQEAHEHPAPDDIDGAAGGDRVEQRGGQSIGYGGQDEAHKSDLPDGAVTRQFRDITQILQRLIGLDGVTGGLGVEGRRMDVARGSHDGLDGDEGEEHRDVNRWK